MYSIEWIETADTILPKHTRIFTDQLSMAAFVFCFAGANTNLLYVWTLDEHIFRIHIVYHIHPQWQGHPPTNSIHRLTNWHSTLLCTQLTWEFALFRSRIWHALFYSIPPPWQLCRAPSMHNLYVSNASENVYYSAFNRRRCQCTCGVCIVVFDVIVDIVKSARSAAFMCGIVYFTYSLSRKSWDTFCK